MSEVLSFKMGGVSTSQSVLPERAKEPNTQFQQKRKSFTNVRKLVSRRAVSVRTMTEKQSRKDNGKRDQKG